MLAIDDNKLKLLKMKEKLLEVSFNNRDIVLSQYKEIVIDIDKRMYDGLIDIIRNANYRSQPLPEQLEILTNIENEYNSFNEFQCRYKDIYEKYASDELELSPIDDIYIDIIKKRIDAINGYLINEQKLLKYRRNLEELNVQLIDSEKKKNEIEERFVLLEKELVNSALNAEGRVDNHGELGYASISSEFTKYDLNFKTLLGNDILLAQELGNANDVLNAEKDKMEAARVCFNNMPNIETKRLYNASYFDVLNAKYRLILLKFANLLSDECSNYEAIKEKRVDIKSLIKERAKILTDLGIRFVVDPFDRIKIDEQLEIIELLGKNLQDVLLIKGKIKETFSMVDEISAKNSELSSIIKSEVTLFNDKEIVESVVSNSENQDVQNDKQRVIKVRDISNRLNLSIVHEKTNGVISRVYELFGSVPTVSEVKKVVPELVIEKDSIFTDEAEKQAIFDDSVATKGETTESVENSIFDDASDTKTIFLNSNSKDSNFDNLFSEVEPFQETVLFTNKYDDVFSNSHQKVGIKDDEEMPELSLETEQKVFDENIEEENGELSLDEQIKALKLVA